MTSSRLCILFQTIHVHLNSRKIQGHYFDLLRSVLFPNFFGLLFKVRPFLRLSRRKLSSRTNTAYLVDTYFHINGIVTVSFGQNKETKVVYRFNRNRFWLKQLWFPNKTNF